MVTGKTSDRMFGKWNRAESPPKKTSPTKMYTHKVDLNRKCCTRTGRMLFQKATEMEKRRGARVCNLFIREHVRDDWPKANFSMLNVIFSYVFDVHVFLSTQHMILCVRETVPAVREYRPAPATHSRHSCLVQFSTHLPGVHYFVSMTSELMHHNIADHGVPGTGRGCVVVFNLCSTVVVLAGKGIINKFFSVQMTGKMMCGRTSHGFSVHTSSLPSTLTQRTACNLFGEQRRRSRISFSNTHCQELRWNYFIRGHEHESYCFTRVDGRWV